MGKSGVFDSGTVSPGAAEHIGDVSPLLPNEEIGPGSEVRSPTKQPVDDQGRFGNDKCRFSILFALLVVAIGFLPFILSAILPPDVTPVINASVNFFFCAVWLLIAVLAVCNFSKIGSMPLPSTAGLAAARSRRFKHIVVVPCYLDPIGAYGPLNIIIKNDQSVIVSRFTMHQWRARSLQLS